MDSGTTRDRDNTGVAGKDDIVRHKHHGVGVVLGTDGFCQVRFLRGKGQMDRGSLTVLVAASRAEQFLAETLSSREIEGDLLRGATLWLRSGDADLQAIALSLISPSRDPRLILIVEDTIAKFPPGVRSRVADLLSDARLRRDLEPWPASVRTALSEVEGRRLQQEALAVARRAELAAPREEEERARRQAEVTAGIRRRIAIIDAIRSHLERPALTEAEQRRIESAVRASLSDPGAYSNFCWKCGTPVHSSFNPHCSACGWLVCMCGGCRAPHFVDRHGRSGACPQEADLLLVP